MTVRPVHLNGMIQNTQDVSTIRHQENQRPAVEQQHIQIREEKRNRVRRRKFRKRITRIKIKKSTMLRKKAQMNTSASGIKRKKKKGKSAGRPGKDKADNGARI